MTIPSRAAAEEAAKKMATAMRQQAVRLGFKRKTVVVASGEAVSYLEKEPSRDQDRNKPPLVCLHGLTASKELSLIHI